MNDSTCKNCKFPESEDQKMALIHFIETESISDTKVLGEHLEKTYKICCSEDQLVSLLNILGFIYARPPEGGDFIWLKK